jgi:prepilin-type N-terminal cleavage/methylation domain-containing protein
MRRSGFTLIECLLGLALSLLVLTAGFEFYARTQKVFTRLKAREEASQAALAAIDRMRIDLLHAGRGLAVEIGLGLVEAAAADAGELRTVSLERDLELAAGAGAGDTRLLLVSTAEIAAGQAVVLRDGAAGEVRTVVRVEPGAVAIDAPLERSYAPAGPGATAPRLLELIVFRLDAAAGILRRRVNASPAQPLAEDIAAASWSLDPAAPLVRLRIEPRTEGAPPHEATVFLKNAALAGRL